VNAELPNALPLQRHWFAEFNQETAASPPRVVGADASEHAATRKPSTERQHQGQDQETDAAHATPASHSAAAAITDAEIINRLAEWVFDKHSQPPRSFEKLYDAARNDSSVGTMKRKDLLAAFQRVYETKPNRPPATGWPLRSPYKERDKQKVAKSD
jgi:hypothetical protein